MMKKKQNRHVNSDSAIHRVFRVTISLEQFVARHECREDAGEGWYLYWRGEEQGGPWMTEEEALDHAPLRCATLSQWRRFDRAASAAGFVNGVRAADKHDLWGVSVGAAILEMEIQVLTMAPPDNSEIW